MFRNKNESNVLVPLHRNQGTGKTDENIRASLNTGPYAFSISSKGRKDTTGKSVKTRYKQENHSKHNSTNIARILKPLAAKGSDYHIGTH